MKSMCIFIKEKFNEAIIYLNEEEIAVIRTSYSGINNFRYFGKEGPIIYKASKGPFVHPSGVGEAKMYEIVIPSLLI